MEHRYCIDFGLHMEIKRLAFENLSKVKAFVFFVRDVFKKQKYIKPFYVIVKSFIFSKWNKEIFEVLLIGFDTVFCLMDSGLFRYVLVVDVSVLYVFERIK